MNEGGGKESEKGGGHSGRRRIKLWRVSSRLINLPPHDLGPCGVFLFSLLTDLVQSCTKAATVNMDRREYYSLKKIVRLAVDQRRQRHASVISRSWTLWGYPLFTIDRLGTIL